MRFLKHSITAIFLAASAVTGATVVATPAQAAFTPAQVEALVNARIVQLQALLAVQEAILTDPSATIEEKGAAQAARQRIVLRIGQLTASIAVLPSLPESNLTAFANFLQTQISAA